MRESVRAQEVGKGELPSVLLFLYRLQPLKITQLQDPYNSVIPMSLWIIWLAKIIFF